MKDNGGKIEETEEKRRCKEFFLKMLELNKKFSEAIQFSIENYNSFIEYLGNYSMDELKEIYNECEEEYKDKLLSNDLLVGKAYLKKYIYEDGTVELIAFRVNGILYKEYLQRDVISISFSGLRQVTHIYQDDDCMMISDLKNKDNNFIPMDDDEFHHLWTVVNDPLHYVKGKLCQILLR